MNHPPYIKYEIRQFGKIVISSEDYDIKKFFNSLTGAAFDSDTKYQMYLSNVMKLCIFKYGEIELLVNDKLIIKGEISKELKKIIKN